jgi:hypothetical protein
MLAKNILRAVLVTAIVSGGWVLPLPAPLGIAPAAAKEYYTRKRVNGRWVTGRFPKRGAETARSTSARARTAAVQADDVPVPPPAVRPLQAAAPAAAALVPGEPQAGEQHLVPLKQALEQRARSMVAQDAAPAPNVRSVTYDFAQGVKTVIYLDGTVSEEQLDPATTGRVDVRP